jgi:hypothetical protein
MDDELHNCVMPGHNSKDYAKDLPALWLGLRWEANFSGGLGCQLWGRDPWSPNRSPWHHPSSVHMLDLVQMFTECFYEKEMNVAIGLLVERININKYTDREQTKTIICHGKREGGKFSWDRYLSQLWCPFPLSISNKRPKTGLSRMWRISEASANTRNIWNHGRLEVAIFANKSQIGIWLKTDRDTTRWVHVVAR